MNVNEFLETYGLEDGTIILEPWEDFKGGIIGITEDRCHIIYSFQGMVESLAHSYEKNYYENNKNEKYDEDKFSDFLQEATEWIDYNVIRSLPYWDVNFRPIVMFEIEMSV